MPVTANLTLVFTGDSVADVKQMIVDTLGVSLGRVAITDAPQPGETQVRLLSTTAATTVAGTGAAEGEQRRKRRSKAEIAADAAAEAAAAAGQDEAAQKAAADAAAADVKAKENEDILELLGVTQHDKPPAAVTKDMLQKAGTDVVGKSGVQGLKTILAKHGFGKIGEIPEAAYQAVHQDLVEALA